MTLEKMKIERKREMISATIASQVAKKSRIVATINS